MKVKTFLFSLLLLVFSCPVSYGQANLLWGKAFKGNSNFFSDAIATDKFNNVYVTGSWFLDASRRCDSNNTFYFGSQVNNLSSSSDGFLLKYDKNGNEIWARTDNNDVTGNYLATDKSGNVYEAGGFGGIYSVGAFTFNVNGQIDIYLAKYSPSGNILWAIVPNILTANNSGDELMPSGLAIDKENNVIIIGRIDYDSFIFGNDTVIKSSAAGNMYLIKFDSNGNLIWSANVSNHSVNNGVYASTVAVDNENNIIISGTFFGEVSFGPFILMTGKGDYSVFLAKYSPNGNVLWATSSIGNALDMSTGVVTDDQNNCYITGVISSTNVQFGSYLLSSNSYGSLFLAKYDSNGKALWAIQSAKTGYSSLLGNSSGPCLASNKCNDIFVYGYLSNTDTIRIGTYSLFIPPTIAHLFPEYVIKFNSSGVPLSGFVLQQGGVGVNQAAGEGWPSTGMVTDTSGNILLEANFFDTLVVNNDSLYSGCHRNAGTFKFSLDGNCCTGFSAKIKGDTSICLGDTTSLDITNLGTSYLWNIGATSSAITVSPPSSTNYYVEIRDSSCTLDLDAKVSVYNKPVPSLKNQQFVCLGDSITLNASGGTTYNWTPSTGLNTYSSPTVIAKPTTNIIYTVIIANGGCTARDSVIINVASNPTITLCCDSSIIYGQNVQLISNGGGRYSWSPNIGLSCDTCPNPVATPHQTTTYTLTVVSDSGCVANKYVAIDVSCGNVFVPNAFSPDAAYNNILYVRGPCIQSLEFEVFDRWGNRVFESNSPDIGWDGNHNGSAMNPGTYMYYAKATMYDGSTIEKHGDVTLVR